MAGVGLVGTDRSLIVEDSLCYTLRSRGETTLKRARLVLPLAIVDGDLNLQTPVEVVGVSNPTSDDHPTMTSDDHREREGTACLTLAHHLSNVKPVSDQLTSDEAELARVARATMATDETVAVERVVETLTVCLQGVSLLRGTTPTVRAVISQAERQ